MTRMPPILLLIVMVFACVHAEAQTTRRLSGVVITDRDEAVAGATIIARYELGEQRAVSDVAGRFSLAVPNVPLTLIVGEFAPEIAWAVRLFVMAVLTVVFVLPGRTPVRQPTSAVAAREFVTTIPRPNSIMGMMTENRNIGATMANSTAAVPRRALRPDALARRHRFAVSGHSCFVSGSCSFHDDFAAHVAMNGAESLLRVSAYMAPWGATEPMAWWTIINRARAIENLAYVVGANQGASLRHYAPYSWPGGSQVVDFDGRVLADASPGPGERIVVAPIDISALRHERESRRGHHMPAHLRTEAYPVYQRHQYPPTSAARSAQISYDRNNELIDEAKRELSQCQETTFK